MEKDEAKAAAAEDGNGVAAKLSRALFSGGKYDNPWSTWQARGPYEALKWTLSRKTPPLPSQEELDPVPPPPLLYYFKKQLIIILLCFI